MLKFSGYCSEQDWMRQKQAGHLRWWKAAVHFHEVFHKMEVERRKWRALHLVQKVTVGTP